MCKKAPNTVAGDSAVLISEGLVVSLLSIRRNVGILLRTSFLVLGLLYDFSIMLLFSYYFARDR